jgi:CBS domain containing-hemolysin-like protein
MTFESQIVLAVLMLLGNAFFVGAEFGMVSARRSNIELQALNGSKAAKITLNAMEHVSIMLAGAQLGVTLCSLIFGAVGEPLFAHLLESPFHSAGVPEAWLHPVSFTVALIVMIYFHVVIGEMVPKNLALAGPTKAALWLVPTLVFFVKITRPAVYGLNAIANATLRLIGIKPTEEIASTFSRDEVAGFVKESQREGLLSTDEEQLLSGALSLDEQTIRSVLIPFEKLVTTPNNATVEEIEKLSATTGFSRFPIRNRKGSLTGYVHIKDTLSIPAHEQHQPFPKKYIRDLPTLKTTASLHEALKSMQLSGAHIVRIVDTRKKEVGVVMLEDLMEELVGDITDKTAALAN